jgi:hypothetical protein
VDNIDGSNNLNSKIKKKTAIAKKLIIEKEKIINDGLKEKLR